MSYILDALRKADAQRVRDPARGIHAQPALQSEGEQSSSGRRALLCGAAAVGATALSAAAWYLHEDKPSAAPQHVAASAVVLTSDPAPLPAQPAPRFAQALPPAPIAPVPIAPVPAAPVLSAPVPVAPVPVAPTTNAPFTNATAPLQAGSAAAQANAPSNVPFQTPALQTPARPVPNQTLAQQPASPTGPGSLRAEGDPRNTSLPTMRGGPQPGPGMEPAPAAPAQSAAPTNPFQQPAPAIARPAPVAPASSAPAPLVTGLPPDAPKLAISGGVYSANANQRMLIVNGQVFSEGADLGSGVVLEAIKPKSAVLKFRGTRYTVTY